ncbi:MAG TPA: fatty acid--CoA ligase family protein [Jatrophihabitans sp.]|nr:fatty acid--CoA ligase family protein [Jatrophihabitans sp.]
MTDGPSSGVLAGFDRMPAVLTAEAVVSRAELRDRVAEQRRQLAEHGAGTGHTIVVQIAPSVSYLAVVLGALELSTQVVLLHAGTAEPEFQQIVEQLRPVLSVRAPEQSRLATFRLDRPLALRRWPRPDTAGMAGAVVQLSSGSTGEPKLIVRSPDSIAAELAAIAALPDWVTTGDRLLTLNSLVHSFGLFGAVLHSLRVGAAVVLAETAQPRDLAAVLAVRKATAITGVPAHFELLTALPAGALAGVRTCVSGGQLIRPSMHDQFVDRHGCPLGQAYGMTELGLIAADFGGRLAPAMGPPLPGMQIRSVAGELVIEMERSPYLNGTNMGRWREGWLYTGDRGELRDGVLWVHGRADSVLAVGGLKVDLTEVENVLSDHPDVRAAVVIGIGGALDAFVETDLVDETALHDWCRQRLSNFKRPRRIVPMQRLPRTSNGKLARSSQALVDLGNRRT